MKLEIIEFEQEAGLEGIAALGVLEKQYLRMHLLSSLIRTRAIVKLIQQKMGINGRHDDERPATPAH